MSLNYGVRSSGEAHGVVLTKPHIVELILDLAGYRANCNLSCLSLLEPSCGHGAFLVPAVGRLLDSSREVGLPFESLVGSILAFDIDPSHVTRTKEVLQGVLASKGVESQTAQHLVDSWIKEGDFLLASIARKFDVVVGNPPYVRTEQVPEALQAEYRRRYSSLYGRADIYVAFIERGLSLLSSTGVLSYICADRWVVNKYGSPLRRIISDGFCLKSYIDLHKASPFESDVIAYPSIFTLSHGRTEAVPVVTLQSGSKGECAQAASILLGGSMGDRPSVRVEDYETWFSGDDPWILSSPDHLRMLRRLEESFTPIESMARVGIGVETGCDRVFIVGGGTPIETSRLVPLVMREDIKRGSIKNARRFVLNCFESGGGLVDLERYPQLSNYLNSHSDVVRRRHVSKKNPRAWFRTVDRVYSDLICKPKLLIPDIAGSNEVVFDQGRYYPHHNLYYITSEKWDMEVLGGLLSSRMALFFVWSYAVKMRGEYLRFQAQYLRRIRLPDPDSLSSSLKSDIKQAFRDRDFKKLDNLSAHAYGMESLPEFNFVDTRS